MKKKVSIVHLSRQDGTGDQEVCALQSALVLCSTFHGMLEVPPDRSG